MVVHEGTVGGKKRYTTPRLTTHGTLKDITLLRFNWHGNPELGEDPVAKVS